MLKTERLVLRQPELDEAGAVVDYYARNCAHLSPWEPSRDPDFYGEAHWRSLLEENQEELRRGESARFFVFERGGSPEIIGACNLNQIVRGPLQACTLGYGIDAAWQGCGVGREAVGALVDYAFEVLELHRVMANYQPENERSARLLASLGFEIEGKAPRYLFLNGAWRDHILTARVAPEEGGKRGMAEPEFGRALESGRSAS